MGERFQVVSTSGYTVQEYGVYEVEYAVCDTANAGHVVGLFFARRTPGQNPARRFDRAKLDARVRARRLCRDLNERERQDAAA